MQTVIASPTSSSGAASSRPLDLDALAAEHFDQLEARYRAAKSATSMRAVDGPLVGRMLAVRIVDALPVAALVRAFAGSRAFIWGGKTFTSRTDSEGDGINRVQIPGALGRQNLFPFETRFGASELDGRPTLILDYDLDANPPWIRKIHDEIREVSPGLFLGPAMWKGARGPLTVLWFALDARAK
jgi:hypothetical protein